MYANQDDTHNRKPPFKSLINSMVCLNNKIQSPDWLKELYSVLIPIYSYVPSILRFKTRMNSLPSSSFLNYGNIYMLLYKLFRFWWQEVDSADHHRTCQQNVSRWLSTRELPMASTIFLPMQTSNGEFKNIYISNLLCFW